MDLTERIERRRTRRSKNELVVDRDALNPAVHLSEPVGRETLFEALLNAVDPLFDRAVPLSAPSGGTDANRLVTDLSADSGKGPWWRRPLRFDADATAELFAAVEDPSGVVR